MHTKKTLFIDMDDVICDYRSSYLYYRDKNPNIKYPQSCRGFFENLEPLEGAIESVNALRNHSDYDTYILTAPSVKNIASYSAKRYWVEKYFGLEFTDRLIICSHKGLMRGDVLIDDNISGKGQENFEGELIHFGSNSFPNWQSVIAYLVKQV